MRAAKREQRRQESVTQTTREYCSSGKRNEDRQEKEDPVSNRRDASSVWPQFHGAGRQEMEKAIGGLVILGVRVTCGIVHQVRDYLRRGNCFIQRDLVDQHIQQSEGPAR